MKSISLFGNGWLGRPLYERFVRQSFDVKLASRSCEDGFSVDIDNLDEDISAFLDSDTLIINITSKNIEGFRTLIQMIEKSPIQKVLFVSTTSVCRDKNMKNPRYAIEEAFKSSMAFETTILRFGGLIGGSRNPANFVKKKKLVGSARVNLIHLDDCIGIINAILQQNRWGETFNACADTHPTKEEFYTHVCKQSRVSQPMFEDTNEKLPEVISNEKLKRVLSYDFIHPDLMQIKFTS